MNCKVIVVGSLKCWLGHLFFGMFLLSIDKPQQNLGSSYDLEIEILSLRFASYGAHNQNVGQGIA